MRDAVAIVEPAMDARQHERAVQSAHVHLQDAERKLERDEGRAAESRDDVARKRIELGRVLCEARKAWPARGPNAKGWGEFLERMGLAERTAREWMALAGYAEVSAPRGSGAEIIPTRREVAAARQPDRTPATRADDQPDLPRRQTVVSDADVQLSYRNDIDRALSVLNKTIMGYARSWPQKSRSGLAQALRSVATAIDNMSDEQEIA